MSRKHIITGIAVVVALAVVALFFLYSNLYSNLLSMTSSLGGGQGPVPSVTSQNTPSSLVVQDTSVGTGATAQAGDTVVVEYTGKLADGTVFDTSVGKPPIDQITPCPAGTQTGICFVLGAGQVIPGWDQGVAGMKVGGTRVLIIPPNLAYGAAGAGNVIPPNATLTFEVKLLDVQAPASNQ